jgi:hypothetical protein
MSWFTEGPADLSSIGAVRCGKSSLPRATQAARAASLAALMTGARSRLVVTDVAWQSLGDLRNALRTGPGVIDPPAAHPSPVLGEGAVPDGGHR